MVRTQSLARAFPLSLTPAGYTTRDVLRRRPRSCPAAGAFRQTQFLLLRIRRESGRRPAHSFARATTRRRAAAAEWAFPGTRAARGTPAKCIALAAVSAEIPRFDQPAKRPRCWSLSWTTDQRHRAALRFFRSRPCARGPPPRTRPSAVAHAAVFRGSHRGPAAPPRDTPPQSPR